MEKFAVDLDKVLDEFEYNEDRAEQMATILAKRNAPVPPVVGGTILHQSPASCYRRPAFEPINLADADFAADPQTSMPRYNNSFSSATTSPGPSIDDTSHYLSHSENLNMSGESRLRNDTSTDINWSQNLGSSLQNHNRIDNVMDSRRNLQTLNSTYSDEINIHRNVGHHSQNADIHWQQDDRLENTTNKINVSGVFSSLNEYLNAGNIEAKIGDVNIISNQRSWNPSTYRLTETEENGNYAVNSTETTVMGSKSESSTLYPSINTDSSDQRKNDEFTEKNINDDFRFSGEQWERTIDVCKISENTSQSCYADLIPVGYSREEQANFAGQSVSGDHTSSDETPDLLDTTINSSKSVNFSNSKLPNQIKNVFGVSDSSTNIAITSGTDVDSFVPKDNQSSLTLLPDVTTSGRNILKTSNIAANVTSDLVTSHGAGVIDEVNEERPKCSNTEFDLVSHRIDKNENVVSPLNDSNKILSKEGNKVASSTDLVSNVNINTDKFHVRDLVSTETNASQIDASISVSEDSKSNFYGNSDVKDIESLKEVLKKPVIGFDAVEELSDTELHQYLQELEDNDLDSETGDDDTAGISLSSSNLESTLRSTGVNQEGEEMSLVNSDDVKNIENNENESCSNRTEICNKETEMFVPENSSDEKFVENSSTGKTEIPKCTASSDNVPGYSQDNETTEISDKNVTASEDDLGSTAESHTIPGLVKLSKPKTIPLQNVVSSINNNCENITTSCTDNMFPSDSVITAATPTVSTATSKTTSTSKTNSVIVNLVSIDCQQISESNECSNLTYVNRPLNKMEIEREENEINNSRTEAPALAASDNKLTDILKSMCVSEEVSSLKNDSSSSTTKDDDSPESDVSTCEVISFEKPKHETTVSEKDTLKDVHARDMCEHSGNIIDAPRGVSKNISRIGYSEVQSCLVRTPRDGSTINVLGEEERPSRPKYLFLPSKITVENEQEDSENSAESPPISGSVGPPGETPSAETQTHCREVGDNIPLSSPDISESSSIEQAVSPVPSLQIATPLSDDMSDILSPEERSLGKLPPFWVPDADAPNCMQCDIKFTVLKRRHHCRACGKVLCSKCCSLKYRLEYMDNSEARVCQPCYTTLAKVFLVEQGESASGSPSSLNEGVSSVNTTPLGRQPNPNNPMEYCSTIPPLEQAASVLRQPPPSVLVPVGVLKREGSTRARSEVTKQVIFSDGIRPGGDLTELDGSSEPRLPYRRPGRVLKRVGTPPGPPSASNHSSQRLLPPLDPKTMSYIPNDRGLPPLAIFNKGEVKFEDVVDVDKQVSSIKSANEPPAVFAINRNLFVHVKVITLDCCVNRTCWCFSTCGMSCVGQDEIVVVLECLPDETTVPKDVFKHLNTLYQDASRGNTVSELGHTVFQGTPFLDSTEHGGFIYIRPSFQCLQKLILPSAPYLVAILVHRWETPWATVFPIRLMLRLGAEYRYYPCMLVSIRNRRPVYWEIGHTIINLLADFRNLSYTLPSVRGLVIHMEDRQTSILLPKNRYDQVTRALNNSNDHVLALASNFSFTADSHLVCIQSNRDESYHTQAINIHNKPRKVTGASFVVFNGALKTSSNLTAKSSIVEDGLMVQITPDTMQSLRAALRNMQDFCVGCGPAGATQPDEVVNMKWVNDDKNFNVGVKSSIDGRALDGIPSIRVHNGTDYMGTCRFIRWTEVFILQSDEGSGRSGDPLDISRLSESLARATCLALIKLLDLLAQAGLTKVAVRATVHPENVGYEAGSKGEKLPPIYMDSLDNELVPVLHKAASMSQDSSAAILELIFHVMLQ